MELRVQELETGLITTVMELKNQKNNTSGIVPPAIPKRTSYNVISPPNLQLSCFQSLFHSDPFAFTSKPPKSLKPRKLPTYDRKSTEDFQVYWQKLEQYMAFNGKY